MSTEALREFSPDMVRNVVSKPKFLNISGVDNIGNNPIGIRAVSPTDGKEELFIWLQRNLRVSSLNQSAGLPIFSAKLVFGKRVETILGPAVDSRSNFSKGEVRVLPTWRNEKVYGVYVKASEIPGLTQEEMDRAEYVDL